jgi:mannose-6-phosphate isomerase-like protein (cupin superfamily)
MRLSTFVLLIGFSFAAASAESQTPPVAPAAPAAPKPAAPRPAARAAVPPATLTIQVTDPAGAPLSDVQVTATGPTPREGVTAANGSLRLLSMRAGDYRLRFTHDGSVTLERDVAMRGGAMTVEAALSPAPPAPKVVEPVKPAAELMNKALPPPGDPKVTPVPLFLEKNFIGGREGRKDSSLGCAATGTATLHQIREAWLSHSHDAADEWVYVVAGEGTLRIGTAEQRLQAGTFSMVPHTISHALVPQGRNPLIVISVLSGPACQG